MYYATNTRRITVKELIQYKKRQEFLAMLKRVADEIQRKRDIEFAAHLKRLSRK